MPKTSRLSGFYDQSRAERVELLQAFADLTSQEAQALAGAAGLDVGQADHMIENVVGVFGLPLGIATNFRINGSESRRWWPGPATPQGWCAMAAASGRAATNR